MGRWQPAGLTEGSTPSGVGARPDPSTTASRSVGLDCPRQSKSSPGDWTTQHSPSPALRDGEDLYVRFRSWSAIARDRRQEGDNGVGSGPCRVYYPITFIRDHPTMIGTQAPKGFGLLFVIVGIPLILWNASLTVSLRPWTLRVALKAHASRHAKRKRLSWNPTRQRDVNCAAALSRKLLSAAPLKIMVLTMRVYLSL